MMDKNENRKIEAILEKIAETSEDMQSAIIWALRHWEFVEWLCKDSKMTNEEIEELELRAKAKKDCLLLVLLCAAQVFNESNETEKQQNR